MTEEIKKTEGEKQTVIPKTQEQQQERTYSAKEWERKQNGFISQITDLQSKLEAITGEQEAQKAKQLEEQQKFQELYELEKNKKEEIENGYKKKLFNLEVDKNLIESGIQNEYVRLGLKAKYSEVSGEQDFATFLETVKTSQPELFNSNVTNINTNNQSVNIKTSDNNSQLNEQIAKEYSRSTDLEKRALARSFYENKYRQQLQ